MNAVSTSSISGVKLRQCPRLIVQVGDYRVFVWSGWRVEWWRGFEYWDRLSLGLVYVLRIR
jgi:hypothetical protein